MSTLSCPSSVGPLVSFFFLFFFFGFLLLQEFFFLVHFVAYPHFLCWFNFLSRESEQTSLARTKKKRDMHLPHRLLISPQTHDLPLHFNPK